ncbi:amino acid ABC transporter permease [Ruminococcaceae bacterium OttesenSCG-928-I18]|nr:amino acid ABC transporter permease [Ruminococcaceae bacterium OttesenSCG-928-I18]
MEVFESLWNAIYKTLINEERWRIYVEGFGNTIAMTVLALFVGVIIGVLIAIVKTYHNSTGRWKLANHLGNLYTTVIRGTPVLVQLLIFYYVLFGSAPSSMKIFIAALAFGINSGAYVSEIIRAGIQSIDAGQTEAGRSLGLGSGQTMRLIVLPQAVKNILPALFNELITLLKETSVAGYISIIDITRAGDLIRSRTFGFMPLFVSAIIYLILVLGLTKVQKKLEQRMAASDRG